MSNFATVIKNSASLNRNHALELCTKYAVYRKGMHHFFKDGSGLVLPNRENPRVFSTYSPWLNNHMTNDFKPMKYWP